MRLVEPDVAYQESFIEALAEYHDEGQHLDWTAKELAGDCAAFVQQLRNRADPTHVPTGRVPDTYLWLVDGDTYLGRVSIRHTLNDALRQIGGHIGYDIRPSARGRGYGTLILALALDWARRLGLEKVPGDL